MTMNFLKIFFNELVNHRRIRESTTEGGENTEKKEGVRNE
jgi:hypothetical protein